MAQPRPSASDAFAESDQLAVAVVILLIGVFGACQGLSYPLFSIVLERQGFGSTIIGLNSAMTPLGIVVAAPLLPGLTRHVGSPATALASTVALAAVLLALGAVQNLWFWFGARFLLGFAICGLYVTSETWINVLVAPERRGRMLGVFTSVLSFGFACGPFILVAVGSSGWPPFLAGAAVVATAAFLLAAMYRRLPNTGATGSGSIRAFLPLAPILLFMVAAIAAYDQALLALFPVYGSGKGLDEHEIAVAMTLWASGNILLQVPIGWLSDRWSPRRTTMLLSLVTILGAACLPFAIGYPALLWPLLFVWGPASYGVYTIALIELGDRFSASTLLAGNAAFAAMWGLGGMAGPPAVGAVMDRFGLGAFPFILALIYGLLLASAAPGGNRPTR